MNRFDLALIVARDVDEQLKTDFLPRLYEEKETFRDGELNINDLKAIFLETVNTKRQENELVIFSLQQINEKEPQKFFWTAFQELFGSHSKGKESPCPCGDCRKALTSYVNRFLGALKMTDEALKEIHVWAKKAATETASAMKWGLAMSHLAAMHDLIDCLSGQHLHLQRERFVAVMAKCNECTLKELQDEDTVRGIIRSICESPNTSSGKQEVFH